VKRGAAGFAAARPRGGTEFAPRSAPTVRDIGINTPANTIRPGPRAVWRTAKEPNRCLIAGRSVQLAFDVQRRDEFDRHLASVYVDGQLVSGELVGPRQPVPISAPSVSRWSTRCGVGSDHE